MAHVPTAVTEPTGELSPEGRKYVAPNGAYSLLTNVLHEYYQLTTPLSQYSVMNTMMGGWCGRLFRFAP